MVYDEWLPYYFNNNRKFLSKRLDKNVIKKSKIFEKEIIKWVCIDDIPKMRGQFRSYFENIVDIMLAQKSEIRKFIEKGLKKSTKNKTLKKRH
jgi:transcription termination factor NusB